MKKVLILFLVLICMLSLVACDKVAGSGEPVTGGAVSDMPEVDKNVSGETEEPQQAIVESISGTITRIDEDKICDLTGEEIKKIADIIENGTWNTEGTAECANDYKLMVDERTYYYHSECGTFNDKENNQNLLVTAEEKESINVILARNLGIQQFRMTKVSDSEFELDYQNHYIMALKDVEVKGIPIDSIEPNRVLNYELVRVHAAVYKENEKWVLVSYYTFDGGDDIGWVKVSDLIEYTNDTKEKLLFPVTVSVDCKDIDTGEKVDDDDWRITSVEGKIVTITKVGGIDRKVKLEDIVYPDTFKAAE